MSPFESKPPSGCRETGSQGLTWHAVGTCLLRGRLAPHANVNPIPKICPGMCERLAKEAKAEQHRKVLMEMAAAWRELANEAEKQVV